MNFLLLEDELIIAKWIEKVIRSLISDVKIFISDNEDEALKIILDNNIDVFLLDINVKRGSGYSFAQKVRNINRYILTPLIFITALDQKEMEAYRNIHCYSYIVKPFTKEKVAKVLSEIIKSNKKLVEKIEIKQKKFTYVLNIDEILYFESQVKNILIKKVNGKKQQIKNHTLSSLEEELFQKGFVKCHRSFIVNRTYIKSISSTNNEIVLYNDDEIIPISKTYKKNLREIIKL